MNAMMKTVGWVKPFGYAQDKLRVTHHQGKKLMGFTHPTRATLLDLTPMFLLSSSLLGVAAQRLVRKLCVHCRHHDGLSWQADGCDRCGYTGYHGRVGVYELLLTTDRIRSQIHNRASEAEIRAAAQQDGLRTMREDGERWLADGTTTQAELLRVTRD